MMTCVRVREAVRLDVEVRLVSGFGGFPIEEMEGDGLQVQRSG